MRHLNRSTALFALLMMVCAWAEGTLAQQRVEMPFRFNELGIEDGLSQGMIFAMLQDHRGFMWFGTKEGLNRYDGQNFRVYRNVPGDTLSLPDNYVLSLAEDTRGRLWIGTRLRGLVMFDPRSERFSRVPLSMPDGKAIQAPISGLATDSAGYLYVTYARRMLVRIDPRRQQIRDIRNSVRTWPEANSNSQDTFFRAGVDAFGRAYVIRPEGVFLFDHARDRWKRTVQFPRILPAMTVRYGGPVTYAVSPDSVIWIGGGHGSGYVLYEIDPAGQRVRDTLHFQLDGADLAIREILPVSDTVLYLQASYRFVRYNRVDGTYAVPRLTDAHHVRNDGLEAGIPGSLSDILRDNSGMLWLGTTGWGLRTFNPQTLVFHAHRGSLMRTLYPDALEAMDRFLLRKSGGIKALDDYVFPCRAPNGDVWVGSMEDGLLQYRTRDGRVFQYGIFRSDPYSFLTMRVFTPFIDSRGRVWIGNWHGISRLLVQERRWEHYFFNGTIPDLTRREDNVISWYEDTDGSLWLGTISSGLVHFDPRTLNFRFYKHVPADSASISSNHVLTIAPDPRESDRYLWLGTDGAGLNRFDRRNGTFEHWGMNEGLPNPVVYGILPDDAGNLWMSTNLGLSRFDPRRGNFWNFTEKDGLQGNEFNRTEFARRGALLYFGGTEGYNVFNPSEVHRNSTVPAIVITGLRIFDHAVRTSDSRSPLRRALPYARHIILPHDQNMLTFEFAALDYFAPRRNHYRYRLEGLDRDWIDAGTNRTATYTNLDPGEYVFRVIGSNNHGIWNTDGARFTVTIRPPWWETPWAYAVYGLMFITLLVLIDRIQRRRVISRERERAMFRETQLRAEAAELEARAVRAENLQKQEELKVAAQIQQSILPQTLPRIMGYDLAGIHIPALEIGGDYYDCMALQDGTFALVIADVAGKGVPAALLVNSLHASVRIHIANRVPLTDIAVQLNNFLYDTSPANTFVTCMIILLHPASGELEIMNAGHNPALLLRRRGEIEQLKTRSLPFGCSVQTVSYPTLQSRIDPGDTLLLFTDGITEAMAASDEPLGQESLEQLLMRQHDSAASAFLDALVETVNRHTGGAEQSDDITALYLRRLD